MLGKLFGKALREGLKLPSKTASGKSKLNYSILGVCSLPVVSTNRVALFSRAFSFTSSGERIPEYITKDILPSIANIQSFPKLIVENMSGSIYENPEDFYQSEYVASYRVCDFTKEDDLRSRLGFLGNDAYTGAEEEWYKTNRILTNLRVNPKCRGRKVGYDILDNLLLKSKKENNDFAILALPEVVSYYEKYLLTHRQNKETVQRISLWQEDSFGEMVVGYKHAYEVFLFKFDDTSDC